jgi:hypothetical protein
VVGMLRRTCVAGITVWSRVYVTVGKTSTSLLFAVLLVTAATTYFVELLEERDTWRDSAKQAH